MADKNSEISRLFSKYSYRPSEHSKNESPGETSKASVSTQTISLRLPKALLEELKSLANERDVPYQSLLKIFLSERVARERGRRRFTNP